jgi:hypothetical protein
LGWGFRATCPDCGREWEGVETSFRFGPWSRLESPGIHDGFYSWFCPRCYFRIYIPRTIERTVWRRWYAHFLAALAEPEDGYPFLRGVAARLDEVLSDGRYYVPIPVELGPVDCPECQRPFEESLLNVPDRLVCPDCGGRGALLYGPEYHCQMPRDEHGFS